jgi:hypothetical protein
MGHLMRRKKSVWTVAALSCLLALGGANTASAVVLDDTNRITIALGDGVTVVLYGEAIPLSLSPPPSPAGGPAAPEPKSNKYYYMPVGLRLGARPDGTPEFLFLKYTTEKSAAQGGVSGGLMHFLMEWGLTPKQEQELRSKLKTQYKGELMGAVPLEDAGDGSFQIVSATLGDKSFAPVVVTSGKAPLLPGGKAAAASRLTAEGAQLLAATFEKARSITDVSIKLNYTYQTQMPAARGTVTIDWTRLLKEHESLRIEYMKRYAGRQRNSGCVLFVCWNVGGPRQYDYTHNELQEQYKFLEEKKIIDVKWEEGYADERMAKIREAFFQFFLTKMAEPVKDDGAAPPPAAAEGAKQPAPPGDARRYRFKRDSRKYAEERKLEFMSLSVRLPVRWPASIEGNLGSWYKAVESNPKCVAAVNLNDPFFQHRDINFILDLDAKEMFDEAVNYVTVNVRKKRTSGNPFQDSVTIDAKYVKEHGINATMTYARGEDRNSDAYEYQAQWSLKGGAVFPHNPPWQKGAWEGVTLAPPVVPRKIDVEGDLEAMKASAITRLTVQIHYFKFGQEVEENIHVSAAANEPLVSKRIFMDRDAKGYAYRLVVNHKTEGKLVLPWSAKVGDDYVYAAIPPELVAEGDNQLKQAAKELGKATVDTAKEKVLDKFKELVGGTNPS